MISIQGLFIEAGPRLCWRHSVCGRSTRLAATPRPGTTKSWGRHSHIGHVIVIMQENRSFDHYFGTCPGADGNPMRNGDPVVCVPDRKTEPALNPTMVPTIGTAEARTGEAPRLRMWMGARGTALSRSSNESAYPATIR